MIAATKGNGPGAANDRPAKTHTKHAHILGSSPSIVNVVDLERKAIDAGNDLNFPTGTRHSKTIATQIAELALAGHAVHQGKCGDYLVSKYGLSHWCSDFDELQLFARKLGVSHA